MIELIFVISAMAATLTAKDALKIANKHPNKLEQKQLDFVLIKIKEYAEYGTCRFISSGELTNAVPYTEKHCPHLPEKELKALGYKLSEGPWQGKDPDPDKNVSYGCLISWCKK